MFDDCLSETINNSSNLMTKYIPEQLDGKIMNELNQEYLTVIGNFKKLKTLGTIDFDAIITDINTKLDVIKAVLGGNDNDYNIVNIKKHTNEYVINNELINAYEEAFSKLDTDSSMTEENLYDKLYNKFVLNEENKKKIENTYDTIITINSEKVFNNDDNKIKNILNTTLNFIQKNIDDKIELSKLDLFYKMFIKQQIDTKKFQLKYQFKKENINLQTFFVELIKFGFNNNEHNKAILKEYLSNPINIPNKEYIKNENKTPFNELIKFSNEILSKLSEQEYIFTKNDTTYQNDSLQKTINDYNKLFGCYTNGYKKNDQEQTQIYNQIMRIQDARIGATKMVLMHVVTGQEFKHPMVMETIGLTETLYQATQIQFNKKELEVERKVEGEDRNSKYIKSLDFMNSSSNKILLEGGSEAISKYKINFDFIELLD
jgi:hypothetical protein